LVEQDAEVPAEQRPTTAHRNLETKEILCRDWQPAIERIAYPAQSPRQA
jgi:hypothetical protein